MNGQSARMPIGTLRSSPSQSSSRCDPYAAAAAITSAPREPAAATRGPAARRLMAASTATKPTAAIECV